MGDERRADIVIIKGNADFRERLQLRYIAQKDVALQRVRVELLGWISSCIRKGHVLLTTEERKRISGVAPQ